MGVTHSCLVGATMSPKLVLLSTAACLLFACASSGGSKGGEAPKVVDLSTELAIFKDAPVAQKLFSEAYGYAFFPTIGEGGLVVGGAHGKGQVYRAGKVTGIVRVIELSVGFQAGGKVFSQIIFFKDQRSYDEFTAGSFEFDAEASAVAISMGAQAQVGTTGTTAGTSTSPDSSNQLAAEWRKGMAVLVHNKGGLMYEATLGGMKFSFDPL